PPRPPRVRPLSDCSRPSTDRSLRFPLRSPIPHRALTTSRGTTAYRRPGVGRFEMGRAAWVGFALSLVIVVSRGAAAQVPTPMESIRLSATAGVSDDSTRYTTPDGQHSFKSPPSAEWTVMVDHPFTADWAVRAEAATVSWGVAPREDLVPVGTRDEKVIL